MRGTRHRAWVAMLAAYVNGTLSEGDRVRVEAHLGRCGACRRELEAFRLIQGAVLEAHRGLEVPDPAVGWARFRRRLTAGRRGGLRGLLGRWAAFWSSVPVPARVLVGVQAGLIGVLTLGLVAAWVARREAVYGTAVGPGVLGGPAVRVVVAFRETASEGQIRAVLHGCRGEVVGGPSPAGFYTVAVPAGDDPERALADALACLRRSPAVVRLAERASGGLP